MENDQKRFINYIPSFFSSKHTFKAKIPMIQSPHCSKSQKSLTKIKTTKKSLETIDFGFFSKKNDAF